MASATSPARTQLWLMARAVPRVAPLGVVAAVGAVMTLLVVSTDNPATAQSRLRFAGACLAASIAFVLDDDAALTLAGSPATLRARRAVRVAVAVGLATAVFVVMMVLADARSGAGRPPAGYLLEVAVLGCVALAAGTAATGRTDDGRGGNIGALVTVVIHCSVYLPARWWWPLTARPETVRLLVIGLIAALIAAVASADPAARRPFHFW